MSSTVEEIDSSIREAIATGFRGRLLDRGLARSMIWVDGQLPDGSPRFADTLSYDLLSYAYSLLSQAIRLRELGGDNNLCRAAFEKSAIAMTNVVHNGDPNSLEKGFHKILAAAAYHLGHFSAKAYSLIHDALNDENLSLMEQVLALLILRQFDNLESVILEWKRSGIGSDALLREKLDADIDKLNQGADELGQVDELGISSVELPVIDLAITDNYYSAIFEFLFALETGNGELLQEAIQRVNNCLSVSSDFNLIPQWWVLRLTKHLLNDLWESSFHRVIPVSPLDGSANNDWNLLRCMFIASLFKRNKAEIDLWPSQLEGAVRAVNDFDDLVVSLPTSAGKTRIAELCILRCLAIGKRVLFITPLRALSAQTESSLRKTFLPLGKSVSSLYGSIGTSDFEQDVLKSRDIVVGTPEKLDFALRNDPSVIDDVGLVVLDEGHMIGLNEREIHYEVQIQRLLRRSDSNTRRIVCLSAILPEGDQFDDFVSWIRRDKIGGAIKSDWRPTDLRFGEVIWGNGSARVNLKIAEEQAFIPNYIQEFVPPLPNPGYRRKPFPDNTQELTLATAWRLVKDEHTVLIYCPQRRSVEAFATSIIDLHARGALETVLTVPEQDLELARALGQEWLGNRHPIIECLKIGVAIHHATLPTPFRKEIEKLLRQGILKITVSSPTLAQGLNLAATSVIVHSLHRNGELIDASEFKNVVGRAGRAFVDTHGLVLHPIFDEHEKRRRNWRSLVDDTTTRNMESGLVLLVASLLKRMQDSLNSSATNQDLYEYVLNNAQVWNFPSIAGESDDKHEIQATLWNRYIVSLDTALLSMLGENDIPSANISEVLDVLLQSSLWQRRLNRHFNNEQLKSLFNSVLVQRARHIWSVSTPRQRKGYFLAGVGLATGQQLDAIAQQANTLLVNANDAIAVNDQGLAISEILQLAELIFLISPFVPDSLPDNWREILTAWLKGDALTECSLGNVDDALRFIEDGVVYRLSWGIEAVRVRAQANEDIIVDELIADATIDDYQVGLVTPAIENGTLNRSAALLMQAGFNSRNAAIHAVTSTNAGFSDNHQFKVWLNSKEVIDRAMRSDWPTSETAELWRAFYQEYGVHSDATWNQTSIDIPVTWNLDYLPQVGKLVKLSNYKPKCTYVLGSDGEEIGQLCLHYDLLKSGIYYSQIMQDTNMLQVHYWGVEKDPFNLKK